jgi:hypothetical protein
MYLGIGCILGLAKKFSNNKSEKIAKRAKWIGKMTGTPDGWFSHL